MIKLQFDNEESWLEARKTKITGSRLKEIVVKRGTTMKIGFYELIAERLALPSVEENPMDRGHRLEEEALEVFEKETGKTVDKSLIMWVREDNESIAISPDGVIGDTEAVEVKCLASSRHLEALINSKIPDEYEFQVLQYFIVNELLETLYFVFYDPRLSVKQYFCIPVTRASLEEDIKVYFDYQENVLKQVDDIVNSLTF